MSAPFPRPFDRASRLEIARDVTQGHGAYRALTEEPWLRFASRELFPPRGFVVLRYASSLFDPPVRPLLRYWFDSENFRDEILPAPNEGLGYWIGRVPAGCAAVWISPTNREGPFDFHVLEIREASLSELASRALRAPKRLFFAVSAGLVGLGQEAELNWRWALGTAPLSSYPAWRKSRRAQGAEGAALARARGRWEDGPRVGVFLDAAEAAAGEIDDSCEAIARQSYRRWRVRFLGAPRDAAAAERLAAWEREAGFGRAASGESAADFHLVARLRAGDLLADDAIACFVEHFARHPQHRLAYADETRAAPGSAPRPVYRPGWSPILQLSGNYLGRAAFFRAGLLAGEPDWTESTAEELVDRLALRATPEEVGALRRPLFHFARPPVARSRVVDAVYREATPSVSIVIPTRDRADLLQDCLESVFARSAYRNYRVVVVDNDSVEARTHALLGRLQATHDRLVVAPSPGAFNFSALSNAGAEAAPGDYLLFLNNDTQVVTPDWIERLLYFAVRPDVGAVGAKLLYPNRLTQHVGVLLGMGGVAGHFGAGLDAGAPGWMGRNLAPHEVSAVTGACLMVERRKFEAVGRFDAVNLPVDLNDIDLCLRLAARGWRTICQSQVVLIHRQSASRGGGLRLQRVYEKERRFFQERWRSRIRDDAYFHPGLSLYANEEALP